MYRPLVPLLAVALIGCGGGDDPELGVLPDQVDPADGVSADGGNGDGGTGENPVGGPTVPVRIYGTTPAPAQDGLVAVPSECGDTFDSSNPGFAIVDAQLPPDWNAVGSGGGSLRYERDGVERTLTVGIGQHADGTEVAGVLGGMFPGEAEEVGSVTWGTRTYPVVFDGTTYGFAALAGEIDNLMGQNVDFVFEARFGDSGSGDTTVFGEETVLAVFESMSLNACAFDEYTSAIVDPEITIVD